MAAPGLMGSATIDRLVTAGCRTGLSSRTHTCPRCQPLHATPDIMHAQLVRGCYIVLSRSARRCCFDRSRMACFVVPFPKYG